MSKESRLIKSMSPKLARIAGEMVLPNTSGDHVRGLKRAAPVDNKDLVNKEYVDGKFPVTHASTTGQTTDDHHAEAHSIVSHNDTTGTGAELNTLTDDSMADALHRHSELSASDGDPDPSLSVDAAGQVGIGATPSEKLEVAGSTKISGDVTVQALNATSEAYLATAQGHVGIGFDADDALGAQMWDAPASIFTSGVYQWVVYNIPNNVMINDANTLKITRVNSSGNTAGAYVYLRNSYNLNSDLTIGKTYKITLDAKVTAGGAVYLMTSGTTTGDLITETVFTSKTIYFVAASTTGDFLRFDGLGIGHSVWIDNIVMKLVTVSDGSLIVEDKVGIGTASPAASALLDLTATTGALLLPRMTTAQKNALTAVNGMLVYDSTLNQTQTYENGAWRQV